MATNGPTWTVSAIQSDGTEKDLQLGMDSQGLTINGARVDSISFNEQFQKFMLTTNGQTYNAEFSNDVLQGMVNEMNKLGQNIQPIWAKATERGIFPGQQSAAFGNGAATEITTAYTTPWPPNSDHPYTDPAASVTLGTDGNISVGGRAPVALDKVTYTGKTFDQITTGDNETLKGPFYQFSVNEGGFQQQVFIHQDQLQPIVAKLQEQGLQNPGFTQAAAEANTPTGQQTKLETVSPPEKFQAALDAGGQEFKPGPIGEGPNPDGNLTMAQLRAAPNLTDDQGNIINPVLQTLVKLEVGNDGVVTTAARPEYNAAYVETRPPIPGLEL